jgi:hypothetical protein
MKIWKPFWQSVKKKAKSKFYAQRKQEISRNALEMVSADGLESVHEIISSVR